MKKTCILILILVLAIVSILFMLKGFKIEEKTFIPSINQIKEMNGELENEISEANRETKYNYDKALEEVKISNKEMLKKKEQYEEITMIEAEKEENKVNQIDKYEVETLWVRIGNHATKNDVVIKIDVTTSTQGIGDLYNLRFTALGGYISISEFIHDIENDSELGFKIEEFKMMRDPDAKKEEEGKKLLAQFVCKDVAIKDVVKSENPEEKKDENNKETKDDKNNKSDKEAKDKKQETKEKEANKMDEDIGINPMMGIN